MRNGKTDRMQGYHQEPHYAQTRMGGSPRLQSGVQQFMNGVYAWMAAGVGLTAAVAYGISQSPAALQLIFGTPLRWVLMFVPLIMAWMLPPRIPNMDRGMAVGAFMLFAATLGAALAYVPLIYTAASIGAVLLATIGMFAGMALIGYTTKKDLTGMGQFLTMALIGAVIASIVSVFLLPNAVGMSLVISAIVAVVAAGLTAYHTQAVKQLYLMNGGQGNLAILGALLLYVDFINLFLSLLRLFGGTRE